MKKPFLNSLLAAACLLSNLPAIAEDINLFAISSSSASAPNVLVLLDNTSNWSDSAQAWSKASVTNKCAGDATCLGYVTSIFGSNLSLTQGQVEVGALKLVLNKLVCSNTTNPISINVGLMLLTPNKGTFTNDSGSNTDNSGVSGIIRKAIVPLSNGGTNCANLTGDLNTLYNNITSSTYKAASNANYGGAMFEAYKYFGGYTSPAHATDGVAGSPTGHVHFANKTFVNYTGNNNPNATLADPAAFTDSSKTAFNSPNAAGGGSCAAKNYILLVGNTWPNKDGNSGNTSSSNTYSPNNLVANYFAGNSPYCCINMSGGEWLGDVWARFIANADVSSAAGQQAVFTDAINVYNASADSNQTSLLRSMSEGNGRGTYYEVGGDLGRLVFSFQDFFQSISATNTAFSSASLPVSVNTQGTYLNQIYIGMFRPNASARWPGNLKQYKMALVDPNTLRLVDADGTAAIDSNSGFIIKTARSHWTPTIDDTYWAGMNWPLGMVNQNPDSNHPDGNVVEKGAQGYKLRGSPTATSISRNIMTCGSCGDNSSLTSFATSNSTLVTALGGSGNNALIDWERGLNNNGDETFVAATATRPSVHGDVLHSRPVAVNFGGDDPLTQAKVVVFYGGNEGILHAINGNREGGLSIGSAAPGVELWSFVAPEFYSSIANMRSDSPLLYSPPSATQKPYGMDGPVTAYKLSATQARVFATMRRGGRALYAFDFDVSDSANPTLKWKRSYTDSGLSGLGQTWSVPRLLKTSGHVSSGTPLPMLIMGGGYDTCEDADPNSCTSSSKGNHIYVLDAAGGTVLKDFDLGTLFGTYRGVVGDITVVPTNQNGLATFAYAADLGGNIYRISGVDANTPFATTDPSNWTITKIASLGGSGTDARKFMFAPDVVLDSGIYYVLVGSGDREKPLPAYTSAYAVQNYFFMVKDNPTNTTWLSSESSNCGGASVICLASLSSVASNPSAATLAASKGWYLALSAAHEQVVTSAITLFGTVTFSTHIPPIFNDSTCTSDLGTTHVYNIAYTNAASENGTSTPFEAVSGGGLPPSPVAGMVTLSGTESGTGEPVTVPFVIGASPTSGLETKKGGGGSSTTINQPKRRVYWYIQQ
jgi:type IV pilus assembly protein PilY1